MNRQPLLRAIASVLLLLVATLLALGGTQLIAGGPAVWPDVVADEATVVRTAMGMLVLAMLLAIAAIATLRNARWAMPSTTLALFIFVIGAFWAHYVLFRELAPGRMATNIVVSAAVLLLLRWSDRHASPRPSGQPPCSS